MSYEPGGATHDLAGCFNGGVPHDGPCFERHRPPGEFDAARQRTEAEDRALELRTLADHLAQPTAEQRRAVLDRERQKVLDAKARARGGQRAIDDGA